MNVSRRGFVSLLAAAGAMPSDSADGMALSKSTFDSLPSAGSFDVVVVGGSCTGVFAALRAAETGLRVALIEMSGGFGGTATQGLVPVWHSLYSSDGKRKIIGGLTDEVIEELVRRGEARKAEPGNPGIGTILNVAGLQLLLDERVRAMRTITPMLHTRVAATVGDSRSNGTERYRSASGSDSAFASLGVSASVFSESPSNLSLWTCPQPIENHATFLKLRSLKCAAARRPISTWSLVTRGTDMSGRLAVRSTTGTPLRMRERMHSHEASSLRKVAITPSPFQASGLWPRRSCIIKCQPCSRA
jgi:hypothetical protein